MLIASQLPVTDWHAVIGDPNQADAICVNGRPKGGHSAREVDHNM